MKKPKRQEPIKRLTIVQVAALIKKPYQSARNMMLSGKFGPSKYDEESRQLTVKATGVDAYLAAEERKSSTL